MHGNVWNPSGVRPASASTDWSPYKAVVSMTSFRASDVIRFMDLPSPSIRQAAPQGVSVYHSLYEFLPQETVGYDSVPFFADLRVINVNTNGELRQISDVR